MNFTQLKQRWQNNLWYGEQRRQPDPDRPLRSVVYIQPDYSKPWFIDISPWDGGAVQLGVTKSKGCSGVWIKGVDGSVNSNHFITNYTTAVSVGLPRSSYAWLYRDANVRAIAQAQAFNTLLNKYPPSPELLPMLDFEYTKYAGVQSNPDFTDLRKWLVEWLRLGNPKPILYSGKYYMDQYGALSSDIRDMIEGLNIANYSSLNPPLPLGFSEWNYHQFTSSGDAVMLAPNDVGKVALDLSYGRVAVSPPPPGGTMDTWLVITTSLKVRSGPGTVYGQTQGLNQGDKFDGFYDAATGWIHLSKIYRVNGTVIVFDGWCSGNELYVSKISIVPPPAPKVKEIQMTLAVGSVVSYLEDGVVVWTTTA